MTLLNWSLHPQQVIVFSDTLALGGSDHHPGYFGNKVFMLPHLNALVAGTGAARVPEDFYLRVNSSLVVKDVLHLSEFAPRVLREVYERASAELGDIGTVTIYTWGLNRETGEFVGVKYLSGADFAAEQMQSGIALKPPPEAGFTTELNNIDSFIEMALVQQTEDRKKPRMERVGIGGDLIIYLLEPDGAGRAVTTIRTLQAFPGRDDDWEMILAGLPANKGTAFSREMFKRHL